MNDPNSTDGQDQAVMDDLMKEFLERAGKGDRDIFDFALEHSDKFCDSGQGILMGLMRLPEWSAWTDFGPTEQDAHLAMWVTCARQALLNVMEKQVSEGWCKMECIRRNMQKLDWGMEESF